MRRRRGQQSAAVIVILVCIVAVEVLAPTPVSAQGQQQKPDSLKTRTEIILDRLRAVRPLVVAGDTSAQDSAAADSARAAAARPTRPAQGGRPASTPMQRDSTMQELAVLPGYVVTEYRADSAHFNSDSSVLDLKRNAEVLRQGQLIAADSGIAFDQNTAIACAGGLPTVTGVGSEQPIRADSLCFNVDNRRGIAFDMTTEVTEGANWIIHSRESFTVGDTLYSHSGMFTDCQLDPPHYHFGAGEMKYAGDLIVARNVTLKFRDVPVFWLPFFVQSTKQGRRSGILTPQFGINDIVRQSASYQRSIENVGFYWAISEFFGAEVALNWRSNDFTALRGTVDYRFLRQFLAGSISYSNYFRAEGGRDFTLAARTDWQPDERTRLNGDVSYATSTRFIRERSIDPRELNQSITSNVGISRRFDGVSVNVSGRREQRISGGTTSLNAPQVSLTFPSLTLFGAAPGEAKWYNNLTWNGSASGGYQLRSVDDAEAAVSARGQSQISSTASSSFTLGKFGISQNMQYSDVVDSERTFPNDTLLEPLPRRGLRRMTWSTGINFQQRLIGTTTFTPGLSMRGELVQGDTTGGERVAAPTRIDFSASLRTDLFGFLPGLGPLERVRHRFSPSFTYSYSPAPTITERQRDVFGVINVREQNRITVGISQTFEGKPRADENQAAQDSAAAARAAADTTSGPRRRQRVQPITLLSISTDAVVYDFVQAREENMGVQTMEIGNNIQSDLLRGLQFSFAHDLFRELPLDSAGAKPERAFAPHLSRVSAAVSINSDSWFARLIGLGRRSERPSADSLQPGGAQGAIDAPADTGRVAPEVRHAGTEFGLLGPGQDLALPRMASGTWSASLNYSLFRPRGGESGLTNQMLTANLSLQPTPQWALQWSTGYSFTTHEFTDHILTLTRELHDWDANFDFVKAQNGNFSFQFRVKLRANPDIKLDYEQRELVARPPGTS